MHKIFRVTKSLAWKAYRTNDIHGRLYEAQNVSQDEGVCQSYSC